MNSIKAKELKNLINDKSKDFQVVDVRSLMEWEEGHIQDPRVINLEINSLLFNSSKISKDKDVYIICESGGRSSFAQMILKTKGIKSIDVEDGMSAYRKLN
jgi:rhodanese-related sulfurtransferase